ncbi:MAG: hypothetical protein DBX90_00575, partial [Lentisphaerae bacterium]
VVLFVGLALLLYRSNRFDGAAEHEHSEGNPCRCIIKKFSLAKEGLYFLMGSGTDGEGET